MQLSSSTKNTTQPKTSHALAEELTFQESLQAFINEGIIFSQRFIQDSRAREKYKNLIYSAAKDIESQVLSGKINFRAGAEQAHAVRNEFLSIIRETTSDMGQAFASHLKREGLAFETLLSEKSSKLFNSSFHQLSTDAQRQQVFLEVIRSAGTANVRVNNMIKLLGRAGKILGTVSIAIIIFQIYQADDKVTAIKREGTELGLSWMLGMAGGWAGMYCGPGAVVCVPLGVFIGGALGALGPEYLLDWRHSQ